MKAEQKRRAEAKENHLKKVVGPMPTLDGLDEGVTLHANVCVFLCFFVRAFFDLRSNVP